MSSSPPAQRKLLNIDWLLIVPETPVFTFKRYLYIVVWVLARQAMALDKDFHTGMQCFLGAHASLLLHIPR
jgi:hypothetical protein